MVRIKRSILFLLCLTMLVLSVTVTPVTAEAETEDLVVAVETVSPQSGSLSITFSEGISRNVDLSDVSMYECNGGQIIPITEIKNEGSRIEIGYTETLADFSEYMIKLPDSLISNSGKVLENSRIYFTTTANEARFETTNVLKDDQSDGLNFISRAGVAMSQIDFATIAEDSDGHGRVLQFVNNNSGAIVYVSSNPLTTELDAELLHMSFDFFVDSIDYYGQVSLQQNVGSGNPRAVFTIKSSGRVEAAFNAYINNDSQIAVGGDYKVGQWNTVEAEINFTTNKVRFILNGTEIGTGNYSGEWSLSKFRIDAPVLDTGKTSTMWLDNFKVDTSKRVVPSNGIRVSKVEFLNSNGTVGKPLSDDTILANVSCAKIYFSGAVDADSLTTDNIRVQKNDGSDVDLSVAEYNAAENAAVIYFDEILDRAASYELSVTDITAGAESFNAYNTSFTVADQGFLAVSKVNFVDSAGNNITETSGLADKEIRVYLDTVNTTGTDEKLLVSLIGCRDAAMEKLAEKEITVSEHYQQLVDGLSIEVEDVTDLRLSVIVWQKTLAGYNPLASDEIGDSTSGTETDKTISYIGRTQESNNTFGYDFISGGNVLYRGIGKSDSEGNYTVSFDMSDSQLSCKGYLVIYEANHDAVTSGAIIYTNADEVRQVSEEICESAETEDLEKIEAILAAKQYALGLPDEVYIGVNLTEVAFLVKEGINNDADGNVSDAEKVLSVVQKAVYVNSADKHELPENVLAYSAELQLDAGKLYGWYNKSYVSDTVKADVTSRVAGGNYRSFQEFDEKLVEAFILAVVSSPDGSDNVKEVVEGFAEEIEITANGSDAVYRTLANKSYKTLKELKTAYINAVSDSSQSTSNRNPGGSGKSSSSSGLSLRTDEVINTELEILPTSIFEDLSEAKWAEKAIVSLAEKHVVNGRSDGNFYPNEVITREEFVKMLVEALEIPQESGKLTFSDANQDEWSYPYIVTAVKNGLVNGYSQDAFGVGEFISRQDMAAMLYRAANLTGFVFIKFTQKVFEDNDEIADYAQEAVIKLQTEGIVNGTGSNHFEPLAHATRAECAQIIYNFMLLIERI